MTGQRKAGVAVGLWITFAIVVWNVTFDRIVVEAGRAYIRAARASAESGSYLHVGDWMTAAVSRGVWLASALSAAILVVGLVAIRFAAKRELKNS